MPECRSLGIRPDSPKIPFLLQNGELNTAARSLQKFFLHPKLRLVLGLLIGTAVGLAVVREMEWSSLSLAFHDFPIGYAMLSLLVFSGATALRAYRWQVLLIGDQIPLHRLLLVQNVGTGLNSISPVGVLSEVSQFLLLTIRFKVRQEEAAATLGLQRVFDLVVGASLLGVGLLALPSLRGFAPYVAVAIALAAGSVLAVPLVIRFGSGPGLARIRLLTSTAAWLQKLTKARMKLALSLLVTLEYWILLGVSAWILAYGMNIDISLLVAMMVIIGTLTFVGIIPSLPASVGTSSSLFSTCSQPSEWETAKLLVLRW